jgi:hypothetical protein
LVGNTGPPTAQPEGVGVFVGVLATGVLVEVTVRVGELVGVLVLVGGTGVLVRVLVGVLVGGTGVLVLVLVGNAVLVLVGVAVSGVPAAQGSVAHTWKVMSWYKAGLLISSLL